MNRRSFFAGVAALLGAAVGSRALNVPEVVAPAMPQVFVPFVLLASEAVDVTTTITTNGTAAIPTPTWYYAENR